MKYAVLAVALLFAVGLTQGQIIVSEKYFRVPLAQNVTDTIPGTENGGLGNGKVGWLFVGDNDVEYSLMAQDSVLAYIAIDYSDSGYAPATGSSVKVIGYKTATRTVGEDSIYTSNVTGNVGMCANVVRSKTGGIDKIKGGRYIRFRIVALNSADFAAVAADATVTLRVRLSRFR